MTSSVMSRKRHKPAASNIAAKATIRTLNRTLESTMFCNTMTSLDECLTLFNPVSGHDARKAGIPRNAMNSENGDLGQRHFMVQFETHANSRIQSRQSKEHIDTFETFRYYFSKNAYPVFGKFWLSGDFHTFQASEIGLSAKFGGGYQGFDFGQNLTNTAGEFAFRCELAGSFPAVSIVQDEKLRCF